MRIAFCGASGTGKTTLAKWLAEELKYEMNPVGSRSTARRMGFNNPYDVDKACLVTYQRWLHPTTPLDDSQAHREAAEKAVRAWIPGSETLRGLFQRELQLDKIRWEEGRTDFVSDRTTADDFAYAALHNVSGITEEFITRARDHLRTYDIIFYAPLSRFYNHGGDGNRVDDLGYHKTFELLLGGLVEGWLPEADWPERLLYSELSASDLERSKREVLSIVQSYMESLD